MQDENVARRDPGKVLFEYLVGCFGTSQLERATRFPNVPTRARNSFLSVQYYYLGKLTYSPAYFKQSIISTCYVFSDSEIFIRHLNHTIQQNAIKNNTNRKKHVGRLLLRYCYVASMGATKLDTLKYLKCKTMYSKLLIDYKQ